MPWGTVRDVAIDSAEGKWFVSRNVVIYLDNGETPDDKCDDHWRTFTVRDGLPSDTVEAIMADSDGTL